MEQQIYKNILVAIDLHPGCEAVTERALEVAQEHNANLTVLHCVEHINAYGVAQAYPTVLDLEQQLLSEAKKELEQLRTRLNYPKLTLLTEVGSPKMSILDTGKRTKADLIILGSHGRRGINVLLGSTANAVLHHASCDVLAVRMRK